MSTPTLDYLFDAITVGGGAAGMGEVAPMLPAGWQADLARHGANGLAPALGRPGLESPGQRPACPATPREPYEPRLLALPGEERIE